MFLLRQFPLRPIPILSIPILSIPNLSIPNLSMTKWEVDEGMYLCPYRGRRVYDLTIICLSFRSCPKGFRLGKLEPQHAPLVVSQWIFFVDRPNSVRTAYYEHQLGHFESAALFSTEDPTTPVAWVTQHPYGCLGSTSTLEKYRKLGFLDLAAGKMLVKWQERGQTPLTYVTPGSAVAKQSERLGGREIARKICLIVH